MESVRCSNCDLLNFASAGECKRCRQPLRAGDGAGEGAGWWRAEGAAEGNAAPRCGFCGYETASEYCPRCKARVAQPAAESAGRARGARRGVRGLKALIALALVAAVGLAGYTYRHRLWYGTHADFALAIRDSEQFQEPLTVTARRSGVPMTPGPDSHADPAHILKARGLVEFSVTSNTMRVIGTAPSVQHLSLNGEEAEPPAETEVKAFYDTASVSLTPKGQREADEWTDAGDGWLVPIGSREVYSVEEVGDVETNGAGVETREVEFYWRWVPEGVGEAFDTDGQVFATLPDVARASARKLNWGSSKAYRAVALLERPAGGEWSVKGIRASDVEEKMGLSAF